MKRNITRKRQSHHVATVRPAPRMCLRSDRHPKAASGPSAAQRCNEDVLFLIISSLPAPDIACAARACSAWLPICQKLLYTRLEFDGGNKNAPLLARTLRENPHLRGYIREMYLVQPVNKTIKKKLYDWFLLLPHGGLHTLQVIQTDFFRNYDQWMDQAPALHSVRHLSMSSHGTTMETIAKCLSIPTLETLLLVFPHHQTRGNFVLPPVPPLKRLGISVSSGYSPRIASILTALQSTLERFNLSVLGDWNNPDDLASTLTSSPFPRLRYLSIQSQFTTPTPFADDLLPRLPQLHSFYCTFGSYSDKIFSCLPRGLETLHLNFISGIPFSLTAAQGALDRVISGQLKLSSLAIAGVYDLAWIKLLKEDCDRAGVGFDFCGNQWLHLVCVTALWHESNPIRSSMTLSF